jgi:hypothetical protein
MRISQFRENSSLLYIVKQTNLLEQLLEAKHRALASLPVSAQTRERLHGGLAGDRQSQAIVSDAT